MQKIYIIKHKDYHRHGKNEKNICPSMRPLFHYNSKKIIIGEFVIL